MSKSLMPFILFLSQNRAWIEAKIRTVLEARLASHAKAAVGDAAPARDEASAEDQGLGSPRGAVPNREALEGGDRAAPVDDVFTVTQLLGQSEDISREV